LSPATGLSVVQVKPLGRDRTRGENHANNRLDSIDKCDSATTDGSRKIARNASAMAAQEMID
jgi:hypothetical protein